MTSIAGRLLLSDVMAHLAACRPVFHSEADFQFAFAQAVSALDDTVRVRLEVPRREAHRTYVDLVCTGEQRSFLEFKYVTRAWAGSDGRTDEPFDLRGHAALDLARLHFVHDAFRVEQWIEAQPDSNGFVVLLTNDAGLWQHPRARKTTRDNDFRLHEGRTLTGDLTWGSPEHPYPRNNHRLRGTYRADWRDYSHLDGRKGGTLRWLGWTVTG